MEKLKAQLSNDKLAAAVAGLAAVGCAALALLADPGPEWALRLEAWAEVLGPFAVAAFARHRVEASDA